MKLSPTINLPPPSSSTFLPRLYDLLRPVISQINSLSDGLLVASISATAAPTTGSHAVGDFVKNSAATELGAVGTKYIIMGWVCVTSGTPGTWKESRTLTGN